VKPFALAVSFTLAFLLFAVQPMATRLVLPVLGGAPAVWNTAMLTFQTLLLLGYLYAHLLTTRLPANRQVPTHALLVVASLLFLPLSVTLLPSPEVVASPIMSMSRVLLLQLGLPFFVLAATAPLLQAWVSCSNHPLARTPYVLYSASNLGSFAALIGYVIAIEPLLDLTAQREVWSALYVAGTLALLMLGLKLTRGASPMVDMSITPPVKLNRREVGLWVMLAFLPSALSLGVTNYIATDIASVPLLWVVPLGIYLLSFVDAFRTRPVLVGISMRVAPLVGMTAIVLYALHAHRSLYGFGFHIIAFLTLAFALHGYLARAKPEPAKLTAYYLSLSVGGALGGVLCALIAPMMVPDAVEYPLSLLAASVAAFILLQRGEGGIMEHVSTFANVVRRALPSTVAFYVFFWAIGGAEIKNLLPLDNRALMNAVSAAGLLTLCTYRGYMRAFYTCVVVVIIMLGVSFNGVVGYETLYRGRNFYGVEKVFEHQNPPARYMMHNTTMHGIQPLGDDTIPLRPVSYYAALAEPFGTLSVMRTHPVAAIGLGVGSVQCHASPGQHFDHFEINPMVVELAKDTRFFNYLSDCPGTHEVMLGDGRIMLAAQPDGRYGTIILDAFSSDAIPAHLLTEEAFAMYERKLVEGGVILIHTTNRHIDLWPLIGRQVEARGMVAYGKNFVPGADDKLVSETYWVVVARDTATLAPLADGDSAWKLLAADPGARTWTDQYSNILPYLKLLRD
jgi:hypothetical protein